MLVPFDIKFIWHDQKRRNGEACRASPTYFWSSLINLISKDTYVVFYLSCIIRITFNGEKTVKEMKSRHLSIFIIFLPSFACRNFGVSQCDEIQTFCKINTCLFSLNVYFYLNYQIKYT